MGQDAFRTKDVSGNHIAYWQYDGLGRLRTSNDPDFGVSSYGYNGFGDMVSKTDALNRKNHVQPRPDRPQGSQGAARG